MEMCINLAVYTLSCPALGLNAVIRILDDFSFATPKEVARVYTPIFHQEMGVVPKPERIVQDLHKSFYAMKTIHGAK